MRSPTKPSPRFRQAKQERMVIPDEGMATIRRQSPDTKRGLRDRTIMVMLYDNSARLAEILGLRLAVIVYAGNNSHVLINGKGIKQRVVPVSKKALGHLTKYMATYHRQGAPSTHPL